MAASTIDRYGERQPGDLVSYTGASGYTYFKNTMQMKDATGSIIRPVVQGSGASNAYFLGVNMNRVNLSAGLGTSNIILDIWKTGIFTFNLNGTGVSQWIGQRAYALDDQTVGVSIAAPCLYVGEITAIPTTSTARVRIDSAVNAGHLEMGVSWAAVQN